MILLIMLCMNGVVLPIPTTTEMFQLQELIEKSERQIESLNEILKYSKNDSASLEKAVLLLEKMNAGLDQTISSFEGTETYDRALVEIQSKEKFFDNYSDREKLVEEISAQIGKKGMDELSADRIDFQKKTVQANRADHQRQKILKEELKTAEPGLVDKIIAQAELEQWQTNTRMSSQLAELLASIGVIREELQLWRLKQESSGASNKLLLGAEAQNRKLKENLQRGGQP